MNPLQNKLKLSVGACIVLLCHHAYAQAPDKSYEERQKANKEFDQHLNRVYENNLPNSKGSTYTALTPAAIEASWNRSKPAKEENNTAAASGSPYVWDDEKNTYVPAPMNLHLVVGVQATKNLEALMAALAEDRSLYLYDKVDWYNDAFLTESLMDDYQFKHLDYKGAAEAVASFGATNTTASYEALTELVWKARLLPLSARNMLLFVAERFPEQQRSNELLELKCLPYFFGATRPDLFRKWGMLADYKKNPYPGCFYENAGVSAAMRHEVLERFIALADKYPEEGLVAAGFCRPHLNPFTLYAEANTALDDNRKEALYWNALNTKRAIAGTDFEETVGKPPMMGNERVFQQFKKPLLWLIEKREERIKALTPEEWIGIAKKGYIHIGQLTSLNLDAARKYRYEHIVLKKKYKNFDTACKILEKERKEKDTKKGT